MPRPLEFLATYAEPTGSPLDAAETTKINDSIDEGDDGPWQEIESWYIHNIGVGVFTDGDRHTVLYRIDRPAPGARERYEELMAPARAQLAGVGHDLGEPQPWELDTEIDQLVGFTGYPDKETAVQDGLRLTLGAVITHYDDAVRDWCGWRNDVVILTQSHDGGGRSNEILRIHSADGRITNTTEEDILRAYTSYAETVQELIDDLDYNHFEGIADAHFARRMAQAWLARSAANAMLERARHVLRTAADSAAQTTKAGDKPGLVASLAAGLHTDRPNLYRVIPQMKETTTPGRRQQK